MAAEVSGWKWKGVYHSHTFAYNEMPLCLCHCAAIHLVLVRMPADCQQSGVPCEVSSGNEDGEGCMESSSASLDHVQSRHLM